MTWTTLPKKTTFHIDILIKSNIDWNFLNHPGVVPSFNMTSIKLINISQSDMFSVNLGRETRRMNFQHFTTTLLLHQTCSFQWKSASLSYQKRLCVCMYSHMCRVSWLDDWCYNNKFILENAEKQIFDFLHRFFKTWRQQYSSIQMVNSMLHLEERNSWKPWYFLYTSL